MSAEAYDVVIVGGGPVGATLAVFLASHGVSTLVLERDAEIPTVPRAFSFDDEAMRLYQAFGLRDTVVANACHEPAAVTYHARAAPGEPEFLRLKSTRDLGNGHGALQFFHQPILERILADEFAARAGGKGAFLRGQQVTRIEGFSDGGAAGEEHPCRVYFRPTDAPDAEERVVRCKFVVGSDGKTGTVRNQVLKGLVEMEGARYPEAWITISVTVRPPPPDFPLLHSPHTLSPSEVHDLFFPPEFRFICDPSRPSIASRVGPPSDRQYRWEWLIPPGDAEEARKLLGDKADDVPYPEASIELVKQIVDRHGMLRLRYKGEEFEYPWSSLDVLRSQLYRFDMRIAREWRFGRLFLAGDAAHTMGPFMGQGMNSGIRDAFNLAWKLSLALSTPDSPADLLDSYAAERGPHTRSMMAVSAAMGTFFTLRQPLLAAVRDAAIASLVRFVSPAGEFLEHMRFKPLPRYDGKDGNAATPGIGAGGKGWFVDGKGGWMVPQVWVACAGKAERLDDALFGLSGEGERVRFVVLAVFAEGEGDAGFVRKTIEDARAALASSAPHWKQAEVTVAGLALGPDPNVDGVLPVVQDPQQLPAGAAKEGYDPARVHAELGLLAPRGWWSWLSPAAWWSWAAGSRPARARFLVIRPDRFVFSVAADAEGLRGDLGRMAQ
ncbi:hypothetical protein DFJ74DRAFT_635350 [Hyaloraphidium curvatum]|nr:hypothetical protein DFJ74DRAFT_635350 [Hyaloraphidium curvatum]